MLASGTIWRRATLTLLAPLLLVANGCLVKRHRVTVQFKSPLLSATLEQLVERIEKQASAITSLNAKAELAASNSGPASERLQADQPGKKSKVVREYVAKDYPEVEAFLLVRKPGNIRIIGQLSLVGTIFDMASDGREFQFSLPVQGKFMVGRNDVIPANTKNPFERLRPGVIMDALLVEPITAGETAVAMNDSEVTSADYNVLILGAPQNGMQRLLRRITFSRYDLLPTRQEIYGPDGFVATEADYSEFVNVQGIPFPTQITIKRPKEGYTIRMSFLPSQVKLNQPILDDKFVLPQPAGTQRVVLSGGR